MHRISLSNTPLGEAVVKAAIYASTEDPRFTPITPGEFQKNIVVELTVLTRPRVLQFDDRKKLPDLVKVGCHGLIIEGHGTSGLLLPRLRLNGNGAARNSSTTVA